MRGKNMTTTNQKTDIASSQDNSQTTYATFQEFWPKYLQEHSNPINQKLHFIGTSFAIFFIIFGIIQSTPVLFIAAVVSGYFFAWVGHFFVQKNRPLTFQYPLKSLIADFKLYGLLWRSFLLKTPLK
jgi:hypothetical protein